MSSSGIKGFSVVADGILKRLEMTNASRDNALNEGRRIVRLSANAVRAIHRQDLESASALVNESGDLLGELLNHLDESSGIRWAGYVQDAMKEYAEARITLAFVTGEALPDPELLSVDDAPYLNALAEAASELRRMTLDALRSGDFAQAERFLSTMDEVYSFLVTVDFPDGLTGGLRRSTDALRAVLERTRGDLTITGAQNRLRDLLQATIHELSKSQ
ncbi:MAG: haloacid dehalogenase [Thermomicrobiales bacterium]